jgi:hypothetical protein
MRVSQSLFRLVVSRQISSSSYEIQFRHGARAGPLSNLRGHPLPHLQLFSKAAPPRRLQAPAGSSNVRSKPCGSATTSRLRLRRHARACPPARDGTEEMPVIQSDPGPQTLGRRPTNGAPLLAGAVLRLQRFHHPETHPEAKIHPSQPGNSRIGGKTGGLAMVQLQPLRDWNDRNRRNRILVDRHKKSLSLGRNPHLRIEMWGTLIPVGHPPNAIVISMRNPSFHFYSPAASSLCLLALALIARKRELRPGPPAD